MTSPPSDPEDRVPRGPSQDDSPNDEGNGGGEKPKPATPPEKGVIPQVLPPTCAGLERRLDACDLLKPGAFPCDEPTSAQEECYFECNLVASCSILRESACEEIPAPPLARCYAECDSFECSDGSRVPLESICDGAPDCADSEDEQGCDWFRCGGLQEDIPKEFECDGVADCADESDEHDACYEGFFACSLTEEVLPPEFECDGELDCADGSDEHDACVVDVFECRTSGEQVLALYECDGEVDCLDGSDEHDECGGFRCE